MGKIILSKRAKPIMPKTGRRGSSEPYRIMLRLLKGIKQESEEMNIKRGDIYYADLSPVVGSEQGGIRPVLIVQNDVGNKYSPTVIAAAITSQKYKTKLPTHISVDAVDCGLQKDSIVLLEQVRTLDKKRLKERMGNLPTDEMNKVNRALSVSFGLGQTMR